MSYLIYPTETGQYHIANTTGALDAYTLTHPSLEAAIASLNGHSYRVCELEPERKPIANPPHGYNGGLVSRKK